MIPNPVYLIQVPAKNAFYRYRDDLPLCNKAYLTNSLKSEGMRPSPPTKTQHLPSTSHPCQLHSIKRGNYSPLGAKHFRYLYQSHRAVVTLTLTLPAVTAGMSTIPPIAHKPIAPSAQRHTGRAGISHGSAKGGHRPPVRRHVYFNENNNTPRGRDCG